METMLQVAAVGITAAVLGAVLRRQTPELTLLLALAAGVWMLYAVADGFRVTAAVMAELAELAGLSDELLVPVVKVASLSILTRLTVEMCRSAGESGVAAFVETAGMILSFVASVPLVRAVTVLMAEMLA